MRSLGRGVALFEWNITIATEMCEKKLRIYPRVIF